MFTCLDTLVSGRAHHATGAPDLPQDAQLAGD